MLQILSAAEAPLVNRLEYRPLRFDLGPKPARYNCLFEGNGGIGQLRLEGSNECKRARE